MDEVGTKAAGCHPPVLPYRAVVIWGQFAEGLPFPPLDPHLQPPGSSCVTQGHPPSWSREAGEPCLLQGQAGSSLGCRAIGTCTRHSCQEQLPGASEGQCSHASICPTFLSIHGE